ncbi:hypothetical protein XENOCAPTIV_008015 [Xenoophorus captivus]|uniref:Uncharacterized protein n=1 Tax=Xenoophorus captivus TaxID=1517983 RepID=A0ABV0RR54_9TELE
MLGLISPLLNSPNHRFGSFSFLPVGWDEMDQSSPGDSMIRKLCSSGPECFYFWWDTWGLIFKRFACTKPHANLFASAKRNYKQGGNRIACVKSANCGCKLFNVSAFMNMENT